MSRRFAFLGKIWRKKSWIHAVPSPTGPVTGFEIYVDLGGRAQIQISRRGVIESKKFHNGLKVGDPIQRFLCSESKSELVRYHFTRLAQKKHWRKAVEKTLEESGGTGDQSSQGSRSGAEHFLPVEGR